MQANHLPDEGDYSRVTNETGRPRGLRNAKLSSMFWRMSASAYDEWLNDGALPCSRSYYIHPHSSFRMLWDTVIIAATVVCAFLLPLRVVIDEPEVWEGGWIVLDGWFHAAFGLDIVLNVLTGIIQDSAVISDQRAIARSYAYGTLVLDMCAFVIPVVSSFATSVPRAFRLFQLARVSRLPVYMKRIGHNKFLSAYVWWWIQQSIGVVLTWSCAASLLFFASRRELPTGLDANTTISLWAESTNTVAAVDASFLNAILVSMYQTMMTVTGIGYNGLGSTFSLQVYWIVVQSLFVYLLALVIEEAREHLEVEGYSRIELHIRMRNVELYLRHRNLPPKVKDRIYACCEHTWYVSHPKSLRSAALCW